MTIENRARHIVHSFRQCNNCLWVWHGTYLATAPEGKGNTCPRCNSTDTHFGWPSSPGLSCLEIALSQEWSDGTGRALGVLMLAAGAEAVFGEVLFRCLGAKMNDYRASRVLLERNGNLSSRIKLFKVISPLSLKEFWVGAGWRTLYGTWNALQKERNHFAHGDLWATTETFTSDPSAFTMEFLDGCALFFNKFSTQESVVSRAPRTSK